jgi:hypothetical protein
MQSPATQIRGMSFRWTVADGRMSGMNINRHGPRMGRWLFHHPAHERIRINHW